MAHLNNFLHLEEDDGSILSQIYALFINILRDDIVC